MEILMEKKTDFKALSGKAKVQYIWDYYRLRILVVVLVAAFVIYLIYHYATYRDPLLNVIMINVNDSMSADAGGFDEFLEAGGYDLKNNPISLNASLNFPENQEYTMTYNDYQVLTMMVAAGGQDLFFGTGEVFLDYAEAGALIDLRTVLSEETLAKYEDCLVYSTEEGATDPYPCAVRLSDNEWIQKYNYYDTCYFGIFYQSEKQDVSGEFAEFLLNYETAYAVGGDCRRNRIRRFIVRPAVHIFSCAQL